MTLLPARAAEMRKCSLWLPRNSDSVAALCGTARADICIRNRPCATPAHFLGWQTYAWACALLSSANLETRQGFSQVCGGLRSTPSDFQAALAGERSDSVPSASFKVRRVQLWLLTCSGCTRLRGTLTTAVVVALHLQCCNPTNLFRLRLAARALRAASQARSPSHE